MLWTLSCFHTHRIFDVGVYLLSTTYQERQLTASNNMRECDQMEREHAVDLSNIGRNWRFSIDANHLRERGSLCISSSSSSSSSS